MKKILLFLSFVFAFQFAEAQVKEGMGGYATISAVTLVSGTTYNFTITGFNSNVRPRGQDSYTTLDISVGCAIWSTDCNKFVIASISSNTGITMVGTMTSIDAAQAPPTNGTRIAVFKEITTNNFTTYSLPPAADGNGANLFGIPLGMRACIDAHYRRQDSIAFANVSGGGSADTSYYKIQTLRKTNATYVKGAEKGISITNKGDTAQIAALDIPSLNFKTGSVIDSNLIPIYDGTNHVKIRADSLINPIYAKIQNKIDSVGALIPVSTENIIPLIFTLEPYTTTTETTTFATTAETNANYFIASGVVGDTFITINSSNVAIAGFGTAGDFIKLKSNVYTPFSLLKMNGSTLPFTATIGNKVQSSFTNDTFYVMQELALGQHLTGKGYKGAAQWFYNTLQYKLESGQYIFQYRPEATASQVYPFTPYGGAANGGSIESGTMFPSYQNINTTATNAGRIFTKHLSFCQKGIGKGISASIPINYINSVFEITMGMNRASTYDVDPSTGGNQLPYGKVGITLLDEVNRVIFRDTIYDIIKVIKVPLSNINNLTVKIEAIDAYAFDCAINRMIVRYAPSTIDTLSKITTGKKGIILGDSWSVFNSNAFATELNRLVQLESPNASFTTVGKGGMTSEWGKYWIDSLVINRTVKPDYCIVEFFTNDNNSLGSSATSWNFSSTDPYGAGTDKFGAITNAAHYIANLDTIVTKLINAGITPILWMGGHTGSYGQTSTAYTNLQANGYGAGEKYYSLGAYGSTPFAEVSTQNSDSISVRSIRNDSITTKRIRGFSSGSGVAALQIDANDTNAGNAQSVLIKGGNNKTGGNAFVVQNLNSATNLTSISWTGNVTSGSFIANYAFAGGGFKGNYIRMSDVLASGIATINSDVSAVRLEVGGNFTSLALNPIGNVGINMTAPQYKLDIDAKTGSAGNPIRLQGLLGGANSDSVVTSASGVLRQLPMSGVVNAGIVDGINMTTTTGSLRIPRVNNTQMSALNGGSGAVSGDLVYNTTDSEYKVFDGGSGWVNLTRSLSSTNTITLAFATSDVTQTYTTTFTGAQVGDFIQYTNTDGLQPTTVSIVKCWVSATNTVSTTFVSTDGAAHTDALAFKFKIIK